MWFRDPGLLEHAQLETPRPVATVPARILHLLGDLDMIKVAAFDFFERIHP